MSKYNSIAFSREECEQGLDIELIQYLLSLNKKVEDWYNDIHIWYDGECTIIEWTPIYFNFKYEEGKFEFVGSDEYIYKDVKLPDGSYVTVPKNEVDNVIDDYYKELEEDK